jgi:hypothetical protein
MSTIDADKRPYRIKIEQHSAVGLLWIAGWLFSIGYLHFGLWQSLLALFIWPFYVGSAFAPT